MTLLALVSLPQWVPWILVPIHVLICLFLIVVVLLQSGRAADLASAFGGAPSQANVAAMSSEDFIKKATRYLAFTFMVTSLVLAAAPRGEDETERLLREKAAAESKAAEGTTGATGPTGAPAPTGTPAPTGAPAPSETPAETPPPQDAP